MERKGNVLAIMSAKGGTGKTSTTANIAAALASEFDRKVLAIDTNITTASLALHFGIDYPKVTIYDVLKRDYSIESSIVNYMEKYPEQVKNHLPKIIKIVEEKGYLEDMIKAVSPDKRRSLILRLTLEEGKDFVYSFQKDLSYLVNPGSYMGRFKEELGGKR
jgi:MinD-like ATPase involved in chromosome partitioning or flagellar assembly